MTHTLKLCASLALALLTALPLGCGEGIRRVQTSAMHCSNNVLQSCQMDQECGSGNLCLSSIESDNSGHRRTCSNSGTTSCTVDTDCPSGGVCNAGNDWVCSVSGALCKLDADCPSGQFCKSNTSGANRSQMALAVGLYDVVQVSGKKIAAMDRASQAGWNAGSERLYDVSMFTGCSQGLANTADVIYDTVDQAWYVFNTETTSDGGAYGNLCVAIHMGQGFAGPNGRCEHEPSSTCSQDDDCPGGGDTCEVGAWAAFKYPMPFASTRTCVNHPGVACGANSDCCNTHPCEDDPCGTVATGATLPAYAAEMRAAVGADKIIMAGVLSNGMLGGDSQLLTDRSYILALSKADLENAWSCEAHSGACKGECIAHPTTLCGGDADCPSGDHCLLGGAQYSQYVYRAPFHNAFPPATSSTHRWVMVPVKNSGQTTPSTGGMYLLGLDRTLSGGVNACKYQQRAIRIDGVPPSATMPYDNVSNPWYSAGGCPDPTDPPKAEERIDSGTGPTRKVGTFEARIASFASNDGCAVAVYGGSCHPAGDVSGAEHACVYWETFSGLNNNPAALTPVDHGILATAGADYYAPAAALQGGCDQLLLTANRSSSSEYISTWVAGRYWADTAGTLSDLTRIWPVNFPTDLDAKGNTYKSLSDQEASNIGSAFVEPWGWYSAIAVDPAGHYDAGINSSADETFFVATEYPFPVHGWGTLSTEWGSRVIQVSN